MLHRVPGPSLPTRVALAGLAAGVMAAGAAGLSAQEPLRTQTPPAFRSGVDFVPISVTVTDRSGRFVSGLGRDNFRVFEDGQEQPLVHFAAERVPVSLGLALDTSDSMRGVKLAEAQAAVSHFLGDLLHPDDEICLYRFADRPALVQSWTTDRALIRQAVGAVRAGGATALLDTVMEAVPVVQAGSRMKRVLVVISDGRDTASTVSPDSVSSLIRDSDVLIYAIGIDGRKQTVIQPAPQRQPQTPIPRPFPIPQGRGGTPPGRGGAPPGRGGGGGWPGGTGPGTGGGQPPGVPTPLPPGPGGGPAIAVLDSERVDAGALRELTNTSGGRTEIIRSTADLGPATAGIADELSRQYLLGYQAQTPHDGQWHDIRVEVRGRWGVTVRARKGYRAPR